MRSKYSVKLKKIIEGHGGITALHLASNYEEALVTTSDVNRPALQLTGFYDYLDASRIQIIGRVESTYLDSLPPEERRHTFERFLQEDIAAPRVLPRRVPPSRVHRGGAQIRPQHLHHG